MPALAQHVRTRDVPQRQLLAALQDAWSERLRAMSKSLAVEVGRLIRKRIKSKKLVAQRDAWLASVHNETGADDNDNE